VAGCTAVIVGCKALFGHIDRQRLFCAWCKNTGLCKTDECAGWFSKNTLRSFYINLNNLFTIRFAGIFNGCRHGYIVNIFLFCLCGHGKCRIGKTKTERIQYFLFCKGLKVAVSDVDILFVLIAGQIAEAALGRIVLDILCNRVGQLTARIDSSHQYIGNTVSAFLTTLPYIENSCRIALFHPFHVDNVSDVQHNDCSCKCFADFFYHLFFSIG